MGNRWDVVVVGAGPGGSTSAGLLAARGYKVALVDRAHFPRPKTCAEFMSPGVTDILCRLGVQRAVRDAGALDIPGMEIVAPSGAVFRLTYDLEESGLRAQTLPRRLLDALLVESAVSAGVTLFEGRVVHEPIVDGGVVTGVVAGTQEKQERMPARLTVIADGSRSALTRSLSLAASPRWPVRFGLVAHYEGEAAVRDGYGQMHVSHDGYCGVAPLPDGLYNVAMVIPVSARYRGQSATQLFDAWIASHRGLRELLQNCRRVTTVRGVSPIGSRARQVWHPGALLVGDAAGFFDPFTGEGIYRALRSAELAAGIGHAALTADEMTGPTLSAYGHAYRRAFRWKQAATAFVQIFVRFPYLLEYASPRLSARPVPARTLAAVLGDMENARNLFHPANLWSTLRP
jgi:menaquinone-9 beta-reductase